jgi:hypothetical protein
MHYKSHCQYPRQGYSGGKQILQLERQELRQLRTKVQAPAILSMEIIYASWLGDHEGTPLFFSIGHGLLTMSKAKMRIAVQARLYSM